jgi:hypothetical protein
MLYEAAAATAPQQGKNPSAQTLLGWFRIFTLKSEKENHGDRIEKSCHRRGGENV